MITDQLGVFTDNLAVKTSGNSSSVPLMPFAGKGEPVTVSVAVTEAYPATATLTIAVQESDNNSAFTVVSSLTVPSAKLTKIGAFSLPLPSALRGKYARLAYTVGGSPATGKLWAGITMDEYSGMETGQYVKAGKKIA